VRGQRPRDQRADAIRLGRVGADRASRAPLRGRVRARPCRGAGRRGGAGRVGARAAAARGAAPAVRALSQPCGGRRGDGIPDAAVDPCGLRARPHPRYRPLARRRGAGDGRSARRRLPGGPRRDPRARARGRGAPADELCGAGAGSSRTSFPRGCRGTCRPCPAGG
jgi:hypothetical protein